MPRKLPWAAGAAASPKKPPGSAIKRASSPGLPESSKRLHVSSHDDQSKTNDHISDDNDDDNGDLVDADLKSLKAPNPAFYRQLPKSTNAEKILRDPSTSPPPSQPVSAPGPSETALMRPGLNADDIYLMVEDEFLSTAKLYTQHIHHAEYVRLKRLAKSRGQKTLDALSRGTDGKTEQSAGVRLRLDAAEGRRKREEGLRGLEGVRESEDKKKREWESESSEDEYMLVPQLAGLMAKEESKSRDLSGVLKPKSRSRAAAGFEQSPNNVERKRDALRDEGRDRKGVVRRKGKERAELLSEEEFLDDDNDNDNDNDNDDDDDDDLGRQPQSRANDALYRSGRNERTKREVAIFRASSAPKTVAEASTIFKRFSDEETPRIHNGRMNTDRKSVTAFSPPSDVRNTATVVSPRGDIYSRRRADPPSSPPSMSGTPQHQSKGETESDLADDWMEKKRSERSAAAEFIAKRRAAREKQAQRDETRQKKKEGGRADDIPTFIF